MKQEQNDDLHVPTSPMTRSRAKKLQEAFQVLLWRVHQEEEMSMKDLDFK